jgi:hypothetical protein
MKMSIHAWNRYPLGKNYDTIVLNLDKNETLKEFIRNKNYFKKNDTTKTITYKTEILCPLKLGNRIPVLLLFSNPHPKSIITGMFLSPEKAVNRFWFSMKDAKMFALPNNDTIRKNDFPETIRAIFLNLEYVSPFAFYFYPFFSFPSRDPNELRSIFEEHFVSRMIKETRENLLKFIKRKNIHHLICFGKQAFRYIPGAEKNDLTGYTEKVKREGFIHYAWQGANLYLTLPTSQGGCKAIERIESLNRVKDEIQKRSKQRL